MTRFSLLAAAIGVTAACSGSGTRGDAPAATGGKGAPVAATPVSMAQVTRSDIAVTVSGPGRTDVIAEQRVRAPFTGIIATLTVAPGDRVGTGQPIGTIVSQSSQAALAGARSLLASARTPAERADARRALEVASAGLVHSTLRAPRAGVVLSRGASAGDLVTAGDSIATIAATGSLVFVAQLAQGDAIRVRAGQPATVTLAGSQVPVSGSVHAILPADSAGGLTVPVRIDIAPGGTPITLGLFGTAQIVVAQRKGALTVPAPAVIRDDIFGISRIATVAAGDSAHWVTVTPGTTTGGITEILSPQLPVGTRVITTGQVGLPEGTRVRPVSARDSVTP